jgi:hypothetical protein
MGFQTLKKKKSHQARRKKGDRGKWEERERERERGRGGRGRERERMEKLFCTRTYFLTGIGLAVVRVARFFVEQYTKTGKLYQITTKYTKVPQNIKSAIKYTKWPQN